MQGGRSRVLQGALRLAALHLLVALQGTLVQPTIALGVGGPWPCAALLVCRGQNRVAATCVCSGVEPRGRTRKRAENVWVVQPLRQVWGTTSPGGRPGNHPQPTPPLGYR